jgi:hypothetical protein
LFVTFAAVPAYIKLGGKNHGQTIRQFQKYFRPQTFQRSGTRRFTHIVSGAGGCSAANEKPDGAFCTETRNPASRIFPWRMELRRGIHSVKKPIAAHISTTADLDGAWIAFRWTDREPSPFHALELFGYDKTAKHFTNFIHDNFGGVRMFISPGWEADTLTWTGNALAASSPASERFVIERKSAKEFAITWETRRPDADWKSGDQLSCMQ